MSAITEQHMSNEQKRTTGPRRQTPGPWLSKEIAWQYDGSHALVWCDKSKGGEHWRRLDEQCNGRFSAPDAQLLAAAPELLEALQHYLSQDEIAEGYGGGVGGSARDQASAAIAKATGATHEQ